MMSQDTLRIAVVQMQQRQCDVAHNVAHLQKLFSEQLQTGECDLVILPEMWSSGFVTRMTPEVENAFDAGREAMLELSRKYHCAIYGSLLVKDKESGLLANRALFVDEELGEMANYDKMHLFGPGGEAKYFKQGTDRIIVKWRGWRIFLTICYDLRFPVWMRYAPNHQYDLLLCTANWPRPREEAWKALLKARAIDNQAFVIGCNRVGDGPKGLSYPGDSQLLGPRGELLTKQISDQEAVLKRTISRSDLEEFRNSFPVLADADPFTLEERY